MRRRPSVRLRVTGAVAAVVALALGSLAYGVSSSAQDQQLDQMDQDLEVDARLVAQLADRPPSGTDRLANTGRIVQVVGPTGALVGDRQSGGNRPSLLEGRGRVTTGNRTLTVAGDGPFRVRIRPTGGRDGVYLVIARPVATIQRADRALRRTLAIAVPLLTAGAAALAWLVVGRALGPVEQIRRSVSDYSEHDLSQRIASPGSGDEIDRLAATMNALLDRLERAAQRERQLVTDASHELRSPLAAARALLESRPDEAEAAAVHDHGSIAAIVRLQELVDHLLELARHDVGGPPAAHLVDVDDLVLARADALRAAHPDLTVDTGGVSAGQVRGNANALARVVENLTSNAARHARTSVAFGLQEIAGEVVLTVTDDGPGIAPDDRTRVFERFTRLDEARGHRDAAAGAGLGLAIVDRIVARHAGTVTVTDRPDGMQGARLVVRLPIA